ncbi:uncharacterized protein LOC113391244 [Ctenocephalides felis]|uniref:uncharacterized protein LOC113391244 n=1 Tax=Ctenocephalides felis TaxID=7515 RepID=UPI000E6E47B2|nr:uncharacterized protein LOC113391244 [Ctenocephalides felis]
MLQVKHHLLKVLKFGEPKKISIGDFVFTVTAIDPDTLTGKIIYHFSFDGTDCLYMDGALMSPSVLTNPYIVHLGNTKIIDTLYVDSLLLDLPVDINIDQADEQIINLLRHSSW